MFRRIETTQNSLKNPLNDMMSSLNDCVRHSLILLVTIALCSATIQSVTTRFTEKKSVATTHTTLQNISKIKCVEKCNKEKQNGRCTLAGYNKATNTCYLSVDDPQDALDTTDDMYGVFFYEPQSGTFTSFVSIFSCVYFNN